MRSFLFYWNSANMLFPSLNFSWISRKTNLYKEESWLRTRFFSEDIHLIDQPQGRSIILGAKAKSQIGSFYFFVIFLFLFFITSNKFFKSPFWNSIHFSISFFWYLNSYFRGSIFTFKKYIRKKKHYSVRIKFLSPIGSGSRIKI